MIIKSDYQPIQTLDYPDLPDIDLTSSLQPNSVIQNYSELVKEQANQELEDWINKYKEDNNKSLDKLFEDQPTVSSTYSNNSNYKQVKAAIDRLVDDPTKRSILLKIAENESGFNKNAKNQKSSASGLFGLISANKSKYGYGDSIEDQVLGASKLYDDMYAKIQSYVSKYGNKNKTLGQLIYGMWFRPKSLLTYLQTGSDNYSDAQGTNLNRVFSKMAKNGGILQYILR